MSARPLPGERPVQPRLGQPYQGAPALRPRSPGGPGLPARTGANSARWPDSEGQTPDRFRALAQTPGPTSAGATPGQIAGAARRKLSNAAAGRRGDSGPNRWPVTTPVRWPGRRALGHCTGPASNSGPLREPGLNSGQQAPPGNRAHRDRPARRSGQPPLSQAKIFAGPRLAGQAARRSGCGPLAYARTRRSAAPGTVPANRDGAAFRDGAS